MSTLPFLLSVADELDNLNSQSYMDDFGLGFHPHRQFYRTPTIQLSLPASTEWMTERQRCRTHKFVDVTQNNLQEDDDEYETNAEEGDERNAATNAIDKYGDRKYGKDISYDDKYGDNIASTSAGNRQKYTSALNSNGKVVEDVDNIDNSVQMYNLSKKCCKNYHRHGGGEMPVKTKSGEGFRLHSKCMEGNNSSSEESLQKPTSSIEFLTCFLLKKSRASKNSGGSGNKKL